MFLGNLSTANEHEARKKKSGKKVEQSRVQNVNDDRDADLSIAAPLARNLKMMWLRSKGLSFLI
jgi:hypothetical protein